MFRLLRRHRILERLRGHAWACKAGPCLLAGLLTIALYIGVPLELPGQQVQITEAQIKAAFLFNFGKYVTWPRGPEERFQICILGRDPFGPVLDSIVSGEKMAGRPLEIRRIQSGQEAGSCQILFIPATEEARTRPTLEAIATAPVLTVSDSKSFVAQGGMIQFVNEGDRVRFLVNLGATQKVGLGLSSELLKVAKSVQRTDEAVK